MNPMICPKCEKSSILPRSYREFNDDYPAGESFWECKWCGAANLIFEKGEEWAERRKQMGPVYRCALCSTKMKLETQAGRQVYACPVCKGYCVAVKIEEVISEGRAKL